MAAIAVTATAKASRTNEQAPVMMQGDKPYPLQEEALPPALRHPMDLQIPEELQGFTGFEGIDSSAFVIPRMKIVQPTSKEGTPGKFFINLTGDEFEDLDIVVIKAMRGRVLWNRADQGSDKPLCRSADFMHPDSSIDNPPSPVCVKQLMNGGKTMLNPVCVNAGWNGNTRPACDETWNLLCVQKDDFLPFWISCSGTSIRPVKKYLSAIALRRCPLWQFSTTITTEENKGDRGRYYSLKFVSPTPITKELEADLIPMVTQLRDADIKRTFDVEEEMKDAEGEDGNGGNGGVASNSLPEKPGWMKN